jgi:hypothetical protein
MGNSVGGYICQCLHGFQGTNCQQGNLLVILIVYFEKIQTCNANKVYYKLNLSDTNYSMENKDKIQNKKRNKTDNLFQHWFPV